jgi:hypothetical protein
LKAEGNNRKIETFNVSSIWNCSDGVVVFVVHFIIANIYFDSDMSKSTNTVVCFAVMFRFIVDKYTHFIIALII